MAIPQTDALPTALQEFVHKRWLQLEERCELEQLDAAQIADLVTVVVGSDYAVDQFSRQPAVFAELLESGDLYRSVSAG